MMANHSGVQIGDGAEFVALGADIASGHDAVGIIVFAFRKNALVETEKSTAKLTV
jgi:hypothetical protein